VGVSPTNAFTAANKQLEQIASSTNQDPANLAQTMMKILNKQTTTRTVSDGQ